MFNIAIDGPAGSGKSTIARLVAKKINFLYVNTGLLFRSMAYLFNELNIDISNEKEIKEALSKGLIQPVDNETTIVNNKKVSEELRTEEISSLTSKIATNSVVREYALKIERDLAKNFNVVMDGRDIGTVVLKDAKLKIFMWASPEIRAKRRLSDISKLGFDTSYDEILSEIKKRDELDSTRKIAPLIQAEDAIRIDNTNGTIEDAVNKIVSLYKERSHE